jgi:hypothetical protein
MKKKPARATSPMRTPMQVASMQLRSLGNSLPMHTSQMQSLPMHALHHRIWHMHILQMKASRIHALHMHTCRMQLFGFRFTV